MARRCDTLSSVNARLAPAGLQVIDKEYRGGRKLHRISCTRGHIAHRMVGPLLWNTGKAKCPYCVDLGLYPPNSDEQKYADTLLESGYLLRSFPATHPPLVMCPYGHKTRIKPSSWAEGQRCTECLEEFGYYKGMGAMLLYLSIEGEGVTKYAIMAAYQGIKPPIYHDTFTVKVLACDTSPSSYPSARRKVRKYGSDYAYFLVDGGDHSIGHPDTLYFYAAVLIDGFAE